VTRFNDIVEVEILDGLPTGETFDPGTGPFGLTRDVASGTIVGGTSVEERPK